MLGGLDLDFPHAPEVGLFKLWPSPAAVFVLPVCRAFCCLAGGTIVAADVDGASYRTAKRCCMGGLHCSLVPFSG